MKSLSIPGVRVWLISVLAGAALLLFGGASAYASGPAWSLEGVSEPTNFTQADNVAGADQYVITLTNRSATPSDGTPIKFVDELPPGFTVNPAGAFGLGTFGTYGYTSSGSEVSCGTTLPVTCTFTGTVEPEGYVTIFIGVDVPAGAPSNVTNVMHVSGGGASPVSLSEATTISSTPAGFGFQAFDAWWSNEDGSPDTQAGSHPYQATTSFSFQTRAVKTGSGLEWVTAGGGSTAGGGVKDVIAEEPAGFVGDPNAARQCTELQFHTRPPGAGPGSVACPDDTAVGLVRLQFAGVAGSYFAVYNLVPPPGVAASFGFNVSGEPVTLNASVKTGGDYGVVIESPDITQFEPLTGAYFTFWGVPGEASHDSVRGSCVLYREEHGATKPGGCPSGLPLPLKPFLTLPTSCQGPLTTTIKADAWATPGEWVSMDSVSHDNAGNQLGMDGCGRLDFSPQISVAPDGTAGSTPTGLTVAVHVPQERLLVPTSLPESTVRSTTVTLPLGVALNPAAADGLQACSPEQIGFGGVEKSTGELLFSAQEGSCPDAAKVATVEIETPLLANKIVGAAYLAQQSQNPFGSLLALYVVARDPVSGVLIKVAGQVAPDPVTGQIVSTFPTTPQLPFSDFRLNFFGTARAPLSTPRLCGTYSTQASFEGWAGNEPARASSSFQITSGHDGRPCQNPGEFSPSLTGGTTSIQAGGLSPFTMTMSREDGQQNLQAISLHMPEGLSGLLSNVKLCGEPQASQGTCGSDSEIGETVVSVGLGGDPFSVRGGKVFITGPYEGAPYGLTIVNPAKAGPLDVGQGPCDCVLVRAKIEVDPITAALTITTDDTGPYKIPTILDGIPLEIKHVNVSISRPDFTFNPTNCNPMRIGGTLFSTEGASSPVSIPFQVTNCATLGFKPGFKVSTTGKNTRARGAGLHVVLEYPKAPFGSQANIAKVKVDLPKQLPSRLTTLQKACVDSTFDENPALCPAESRVGQASATTPLLPVPLSGPAYFVSHGGAKFPELIIVLQGYGTTVDLHAETFINKAGITSSTFRTVPDAPVGRFELTLPQGRYSALAANGDLCKAKLTMPTAFTAQNGAVIKQSTPISATGCAKKKTSKKKPKHHANTSHKKKRGK